MKRGVKNMKTVKKVNKTAAVIKMLAGKMADISCGAASCWGLYQAKEPKKCQK